MHLRSSCTSHKCETFLSYSKLHVLACVCTTLLRCPFQCSCYCVTGCGSVSLHSAHSTARRRLDILACTKSQFSSQFLWFLSARLLTAPVRLRGVKCFRMFPFMQPHVTTRWRSGEQLSGTNAWPIHSLHAVLFQLRVDFLLDLAVPRKLLTWSPVCAQAAGLLILANSIRRCLKKEWSPSKGWNVQTRQTGKFWEDWRDFTRNQVSRPLIRRKVSALSALAFVLPSVKLAQEPICFRASSSIRNFSDLGLKIKCIFTHFHWISIRTVAAGVRRATTRTLGPVTVSNVYVLTYLARSWAHRNSSSTSSKCSVVPAEH